VAEEASAFSAGDNEACFNGRGGENKYSGSKGIRTRDGGSSKKGPLCYGDRSWEELLCMWGFRHMACHCRNRGQRGRIAEGRRLEYRREGNFEHSDNLKGVENLESLD